MNSAPIGIFDSGYGGLTVYKSIQKLLPAYDFIYLGDNARVPYGNRSFEVVNQYTKQCIEYLFSKGCNLTILACNTASAKALRNYQQNELPKLKENKRVLGVIRPTTEIIGGLSQTNHVGILATEGTVSSQSYAIEIKKFFPETKVFQVACPLWVPLIENDEIDNPGAEYFIKKYLDQLFLLSPKIDTIVLACTHFPLLADKIQELVPKHVKILSQGEIVAKSLVDYLQRHPEIDQYCSKNGIEKFLTTETANVFDIKASLFLGRDIKSEKVII